MADDELNKRNLPEEHDGLLDCTSLAICCSFNRCGSLLAVGYNDGRLVIWDFLNRFIAKNINHAHAGHPVTSISWTRDGHKIVSSSVDNTLAVWEVKSGECLKRWWFNAPIMKAQFNRRNDNLIIVCPIRHTPILIEINYKTKSVQHKCIPSDKDEVDSNVVASFDRRGEYIYTGGSKGRITIFRCPRELNEQDNFEMVSSFKIQPIGAAPALIGEIEFAQKNKNLFLVNSSDRTIRLYSCDSALRAGVNGQCEELRKFQDMVSKTMWKRCCFSGDKEASYVCGGSARNHAIYIWGREDNTVRKILQGTSKGEMLLDVQWHPLKPKVVSIASGLVMVWSQVESENWSAYAPEFKELLENEDYNERESEFDEDDEDTSKNPNVKKEEHNETELIDVVEVNYEEGDYKSSDEEDYNPEALEFISVGLEDHEMVASEDRGT